MNKLVKLGVASVMMLLMSFSPDTSVYFCDSSTSVAYHASENCKGLNKCTHNIIRITVNDAIGRGKRACKICY